METSELNAEYDKLQLQYGAKELTGNQVSSIVLDRTISVSQCRKQDFSKNIAGKNYKVYSVYYPI